MTKRIEDYTNEELDRLCAEAAMYLEKSNV